MARRITTARESTELWRLAGYDEYAGNHQSPGPGTGFPIHDMSGNDDLGGVPDDWQTHPQYYASEHEAPGVRGMKQTQQMYNRVNGKPEEMVDVYRALPHGNTTFNTGDWVTPSLAYAQGHAASEGGPESDLPVIKSMVPAKHLWQNGDSYYEMGYHGPSHAGTVVPRGKTAAPIWQKVPSDLSWGDDLDPDLGNDKPLSHRKRQPDDEPTGKWYHVSTQPLKPGTKVVPRGGPSPDSDYYDTDETGYDNTNRQNHVWLAPSLARAYSWSANLNAPYIHEVKPGDKPQPWNFSGTNGWVAPHAHVVRQVPREEGKQAETDYYNSTRYHPGGHTEILPGGKWASNTPHVREIDPFDVSDEADRAAGLFGDGPDPLASLAWRHGGEVAMVSTHPDHQRQGLATQLFNHVKTHMEPNLHHSPHQTPEGAAWAPRTAVLEFHQPRPHQVDAYDEEPHTDLYHVTTPAGLKGIRDQGVIPQIGDRSRELGETEPASYHFPSHDHMIDGLGNWLGEQLEDEPLVHMLHLRVPSSWVKGSPDSYERTVHQTIPPHMIHSVEDDGYDDKRTSAIVDDRHPDHVWQENTFGCAHTACGRMLPQYRTAAAFDDPSGWRNSTAVAPSPIATQGAAAYNSAVGLPQPPPTDFSKPFRTPESVATVGRAYDALPTYSPDAVPHYAAMQKEVNDQYHHMTHNLGINVQSVDHDPYKDVHEMMHDVNNNKRLQVLGTHVTGGHPFFGDADNDKFRAVHDFFGHAGTGRGFDRHGEEAAFVKHAGMFTPAARPALATETTGQNSSLILNGGFTPQKIALMDRPHWDRSLRSAKSIGVVGSELWPDHQDLLKSAFGNWLTSEDMTNVGLGSELRTSKAMANSESPWGTDRGETERPLLSRGNSPTGSAHQRGIRLTTSSATTHPVATLPISDPSFLRSIIADVSVSGQNVGVGTHTQITSSGWYIAPTDTPIETVGNVDKRTAMLTQSVAVNGSWPNEAETMDPRMHTAVKWDPRQDDQEFIDESWGEIPHPLHGHVPTSEMAHYVNPDNFYSRKGYGQLLDDVRRTGKIRSPILLQTDGNRAWIDDGHHRLMAAQELGHDTVPVSIQHMGEDDYPWAQDGKWVPGKVGPGLGALLTKGRTSSVHDWSHDPETDTYTHPSGHVIKPSDERPGSYQLWAPTVGFPGVREPGLAKDRQPRPDVQRHMDWAEHTGMIGVRHMGRQITSARDQVVMLQPWRTAADGSLLGIAGDAVDVAATHGQEPDEFTGTGPKVAVNEDDRMVSENDVHSPRPTRPSAQWGADVMRHLDKNPWGVTVRDQVGDAPSSGFMVSHPGAEEEQSRSSLDPHKVRDFYENNFDRINQDQGNSYGGWDAPRTPESGKGGQPGWYHDVSQNIKDPAAATDAATSGGQQAVYDLDHDQEVSTPEMVRRHKSSAIDWRTWYV